MKRNNKWAKAVARDLIAQGWQVDEAKKLLIILVNLFTV